jgi:hypothetical protein
MSPTVRIDEEVFDELKKHAEPFVDTPNTVLRRLLGLTSSEGLQLDTVEADHAGEEEAQIVTASRGAQSRSRSHRRKGRAPRRPRAKTGSILSETEYEVPMLKIIAEHGGRAPAREVLDELETRLGDRLTEVDKQELSSGNVRWRNRAQFVRLRLVERGDMVKDSPRGVWEISLQGQKRIADAA